MTQSLEDLSAIYLESTESDLVAPQRYSVALTTVEPANSDSLTTTSNVTQEHFQIPEEAEGQSVQLEVSSLQTEGAAVDESDRSSNLSQQGTSATKRKRTTYDHIPPELKQKIVDYAITHGTRPTAQLFDINEPTIRYWKQKGFAQSRGRKITYGKELDNELFAGLLLLKSNGAALTVDVFTDYAKKLIDEKRPELNFKCSRGWLEKFFKRHNLEVVKSPSGKVQNIVESKKDLNPNSMGSLLDIGDDDDDDDDDCGVDSRSGEDPLVPEQISSKDLVEQNLSEDISPPAKRMQISTSIIDLETTPICSPTFVSTLVENPQDNDIKTQHLTDILKKLKGSQPPHASYQKQEVIEHAKLNGSRSAERKFGVPETTIRYWVKKAKVPLPVLSSTHATGLPADAGSSNLIGHTGTSSDFTARQKHSRIDNYSSTPCSGTTAGINLPDRDSLGGKGLSASLSPDDTQAAWRILNWATEQLLQDKLVGFDELCDRALAHVSQTNPSSAYSSTRKWVGQLLQLRLKDLLEVSD